MQMRPSAGRGRAGTADACRGRRGQLDSRSGHPGYVRGNDRGTTTRSGRAAVAAYALGGYVANLVIPRARAGLLESYWAWLTSSHTDDDSTSRAPPGDLHRVFQE